MALYTRIVVGIHNKLMDEIRTIIKKLGEF